MKDLRAIAEITVTKNLSRAAERLATSQPALTLLVQRLELDLGVDLFLRTPQGLQPTKAALTLAEEARRLLRDWDGIRERVLKSETDIRGVYTLGCHPQIAAHALPRFLPGLLEEYEALEVRWVKGTSRTTLSDIVDFRIDFGIVVDPKPHPDLVITPLYRDTIRFWTRRSATPVQTLSDPRLVVVCDRDLPQMEALLESARRAKKEIHPRVLHCPDLDTLRAFVAGGMGMGILPETVATKEGAEALVPVSGLPSFSERICLVYRADLQKTAAAKHIREAILKGCRE